MYSLCITHRVNEDISWVEDLYADLLIYNKGGEWDLPYHCYPATKIISEVDTYLRGIIEAYDLLHTYRWVFFLKPNCKDYDPKVISYLSINQYNQIPAHQIVHLSENIYLFNFQESLKDLSQNQLNIINQLKDIMLSFGINIDTETYPCCDGSQYMVPVGCILSKSKEWWIRMHSFANYLIEQLGQSASKIFEMLWPLIFIYS